MIKKREVLIPRGYLLFVYMLLILLMLPLVFGGYLEAWGSLWNTITGKATSSTADVNISVGNTAPTVDTVYNTSANINNPSITLDSTTVVTVTFEATDSDGVGNLDDNSARVEMLRTGETTMYNGTCKLVADLDSDTANYTCDVELWYWIGSGAWTINATINDTNDARGENTSKNFSLQETTGMAMAPNNITWVSIGLTDKNVTANENITINNTANKDITVGGINITGVDLAGEDTATDYIPAANFTVSHAVQPDLCYPSNNSRARFLVNETTVNITIANLSAGNHSFKLNTSDGSGREQIHFCLRGLNESVSSQAYSTFKANELWTIAVN